jgi:uncharacterized cupin superfamily protein
MALFARIDPSDVTPEISRPDPARLIAGDPVHTTWEIETRADLWAGIWQSTPGAWRVAYDEWEYCHILSGHSVLTEEGGAVHHLRAGDGFILRPGLRGVWEVLETTRKEYVIRG